MAKAKTVPVKAKAKPQVFAAIPGNPFAAIKGMDGNANSPKEFMDESPQDHEMYFNDNDDEDEVNEDSKKRVKILNFIHRCLKFHTQRVIPAASDGDDQRIDIVHRGEHNGVSFDVCIFFPGYTEKNNKECYAIVKLTSDDLKSDEWYKGVICACSAYTEEARKDDHTKKLEQMDNNYWIPRWKYIVKYLCRRMADDFDKFGEEIHHEVFLDDARAAGEAGAGNASGAVDDGKPAEETMEVFSGCTGAIIGKQGAKINEIKDATHVTAIEMPAKVEGGDRPKPRDPVEITIKGTKTQINAARVMIQAVVDEWASAGPRRPRNDNDNTPPTDYNAGGDDTYGATQYDGAGGNDDWADEANAAAAGDGDWATPAAGAEMSVGGGDAW